MINFEQYQNPWVECFDQLVPKVKEEINVVLEPEIEELVGKFRKEVKTTTPSA